MNLSPYSNGPLAVAPRVAIYWDFENIHASLYERDIGSYRNSRFTPQPPLIDIGAIMDFANTGGSVCINRAYCNWSFFYSYSDALSGHGISLVQLFPRGQHGKNGADIQMCVDMIEDLLRLDVDVCIIVSGDSDYIGAAQKVRQYGKRVIGIGVQNYSNRLFQRVCDEFKFYDTLVESEIETSVSVDDSGDLTFDEAKRLLVSAIRRLAAQAGDPWVLKAKVKPMMLRLESAFDERRLRFGDEPGFPNFTAFLSACGDVVEEMPGDSDHNIRLRSEDQSSGPPRDRQIQLYRKLLIAAASLEQGRRKVVLVAGLKLVVLQLDPQFQERRVGAQTWLAFLESYPDVVRIHGQGPARTVELLVEPDSGGYSLPSVQHASAGVHTEPPSSEAIAKVVEFHFGPLVETPVSSWKDYYQRLAPYMKESGFNLDESSLRGIQSLLFTAKAFKFMPPPGGITAAEHYLDAASLLAEVEKLLRPGKSESDGANSQSQASEGAAVLE